MVIETTAAVVCVPDTLIFGEVVGCEMVVSMLLM
jgi:hypothetical protein